MQLLCVIKQLGYHARPDWSKTDYVLHHTELNLSYYIYHIKTMDLIFYWFTGVIIHLACWENTREIYKEQYGEYAN